jgi:hypothetical protein
MTDATVPQLALVAVADGAGGDAQIVQLAAVAICSETPLPSGGAKAQQLVSISVSKEYVIPPIFIPMNMGQFMATMPYWVGRF